MEVAVSKELDELADLIRGADIYWRQDGVAVAAQAILDAGYRKQSTSPEPIPPGRR